MAACMHVSMHTCIPMFVFYIHSARGLAHAHAVIYQHMYMYTQSLYNFFERMLTHKKRAQARTVAMHCYAPTLRKPH